MHFAVFISLNIQFNNNIKPDMFIDINTLPYIIKPQVL